MVAGGGGSLACPQLAKMETIKRISNARDNFFMHQVYQNWDYWKI